MRVFLYVCYLVLGCCAVFSVVIVTAGDGFYSLLAWELTAPERMWVIGNMK